MDKFNRNDTNKRMTDKEKIEHLTNIILSQQRELLVDFWMNLPNTNKNKSVAKHYVDKYLESKLKTKTNDRIS